jgi:acetyl esterase/lipase
MRFLRPLLRSAVPVLMLALGAGARAQNHYPVSQYTPTPAVLYPGGVRNLRDVVYAEPRGFRPLTLDLYLPPRMSMPKPLVLFIHGGAWQRSTARDGGSFRDFPAVLASVAAKGYVVASVNYRLSGEARFPAAVQDTGLAIQWLRTRAGTYGIDPAKVVIWGSSAGGQIASLIGTACDAPLIQPPAEPGGRAAAPSICVQGVIDWYGVVDFEHFAEDLKPHENRVAAATDAYLGCNGTCPDGRARAASPLAYVDAKDPPFLIQHGTEDFTVSPKQARRLYDALRAAGVPAQLILYPHVAHGFTKVPGGGPDDQANREALDAVLAFLRRVVGSGTIR